jgi:serine/threonine protein kinase
MKHIPGVPSEMVGPYAFRGTIGSGAFSTVKLCYRSDDSQFYACKVISRSLVVERELLARLQHEISINRKLRHPGLVATTDLLRDADNFYLFMEFCPNGELFQHIVGRRRLAEDEAKSLLLQLLDALGYVHSMDVVHRDLKPENILFDQYGHIKISDFGLARFCPPDALCHTPCGSPCYASPELLSGRPYDARLNDIWSVGVILFAMVSGELPWTKRNQSELFAQIRRGEYEVPSYVSRQCADLIRRLLTVDVVSRISLPEAIEHPWLDGVALQQTPMGALRRISLRKFEQCFEPRVPALPTPMRRTKSTGAMDIQKTMALLARPLMPAMLVPQTPNEVKRKGLPPLPQRAVVPGIKKTHRLARPTSRLRIGGSLSRI